jgi:hypothetical protein
VEEHVHVYLLNRFDNTRTEISISFHIPLHDLIESTALPPFNTPGGSQLNSSPAVSSLAGMMHPPKTTAAGDP